MKKATIEITERQSQIILHALNKAPVSGSVADLAKFLEEMGDVMKIIQAPFLKKEEELDISAEIVEGKSGRRKKRSEK